MSELSIRAESLSKRYRIGLAQGRHDTLRDTLAAGLSRLRRPSGEARRAAEIWALRDVSFEVRQGEVVGVIGRNGAGKSTLLKILSRITEPTAGRAHIHGRVGSLLEVGTGFHPELTGRENIFLNGAILGMRRHEIERKFDEIVDFAEIERFLDTPVKRYSSGMYVRLAFAVAAHLEPEILLVDEVLAVGDAAFQKKCLGKMGDVAREGRTVLFVSHNMAAVKNLCPRGLWFEEGQVLIDDTAEACIGAYTARTEGLRNSTWERGDGGISPLQFRKISVDLEGRQPELRLKLDIVAESVAAHKKAFVAVDVASATGATVMQILPSAQPFIGDEIGLHQMRLRVNLPPLIPGSYVLTAWLGSHNTETLDKIENCAAFVVTSSPTEGRTFPHTVDHGYIVPTAKMEYTTLRPQAETVNGHGNPA
jgi:lipopolysaccharide transport system ATP-binding protein